jgi:arginyl-tRNA synthetase
VFKRRADGAVIIDLTPDGLDEKVVLRSDGTSVYITQDLGTAELRHKAFNMDRMIYVVGNEQDYHFKVLKLTLQKVRLSVGRWNLSLVVWHGGIANRAFQIA